MKQICRFCKSELTVPFADLGFAPPSNSFLKPSQLEEMEAYFPLKVYACSECYLVQVAEYKAAKEIFSEDYVYFSSYSKSWLQHCEAYAKKMIQQFSLDSEALVVELASNDGYLLQYFKQAGVPVLGIEPTSSTAKVAIQKGIDTEVAFFGVETAKRVAASRGRAQHMAANNVLAHVPDINDFVGGIRILLSEDGVFTAEFPHLLNLISQNQFDTIYHEHFSYLSLLSIKAIFEAQGLMLFDVEEIPTHGGSLRIYAQHRSGPHPLNERIATLESREREFGLADISSYPKFQSKIEKIKNDFLMFLLKAKADGKTVAAYGAAAKGNTLLNYCGVKTDLIDFVVDASPYKQGLYLPGAHIPVTTEDRIRSAKPDFIVILPWNLKEEISSQLKYTREWGAKFVVAVPKLSIN